MVYRKLFKLKKYVKNVQDSDLADFLREQPRLKLWFKNIGNRRWISMTKYIGTDLNDNSISLELVFLFIDSLEGFEFMIKGC